MNPYLELNHKYRNGDITKELYLKSYNLLQELESKDQKLKAQRSEEEKIRKLKAKKLEDEKNKKLKVIKLENEKARKVREKKLAAELKIKQSRQYKLEKIKEYHELLKSPTLAKQKQKETLHRVQKMSNQERLQHLAGLSVVSEFNSEHHYSKKVVLLEGLIVRKQCQLDSFGNYMFQNEIRSLQKLAPYPHFPILVAHDPYNLIIYMTYCGPTMNSKNLPPDWKAQFEEISEILSVLEVNSNDMLLRNTCFFNGEISIIDFGLDTKFGRGLPSVLRDFYGKLSALDPKKKAQQLPKSEKSIQQYNRDYPEWKAKLQKFKEFKTFMESQLQKMRAKKVKKRLM